jgi:hypothetical protein
VSSPWAWKLIEKPDMCNKAKQKKGEERKHLRQQENKSYDKKCWKRTAERFIIWELGKFSVLRGLKSHEKVLSDYHQR